MIKEWKLRYFINPKITRILHYILNKKNIIYNIRNCYKNIMKILYIKIIKLLKKLEKENILMYF